MSHYHYFDGWRIRRISARNSKLLMCGDCVEAQFRATERGQVPPLRQRVAYELVKPDRSSLFVCDYHLYTPEKQR